MVTRAAEYQIVMREHVRGRFPEDVRETRCVVLPAGHWVVVPCDDRHRYTEAFTVSHNPDVRDGERDGEDPSQRDQTAAYTKPVFAIARRGTVPDPDEIEDLFTMQRPGVWVYSNRVYDNDGADEMYDILIRSPVDASLRYSYVYSLQETETETETATNTDMDSDSDLDLEPEPQFYDVSLHR